MNAATRQRLRDALVNPEAAARLDGAQRKFCDEVTNGDLDRLAPVIDALLREREDDLRKSMLCGHPTACLEMAPLLEQPRIRAEKCGFFIVDAKNMKYICSQCEREKMLQAQATEGPKPPVRVTP